MVNEKRENVISALRDRVRELERELGSDYRSALMLRLGLTKTEAAIIAAVLVRPGVTRKGLQTIAVDGWEKQTTSTQSIAVTVCNARKKLAPHGVEIIGKQWYGYTMPDPSKTRLARILGVN